MSNLKSIHTWCINTILSVPDIETPYTKTTIIKNKLKLCYIHIRVSFCWTWFSERERERGEWHTRHTKEKREIEAKEHLMCNFCRRSRLCLAKLFYWNCVVAVESLLLLKKMLFDMLFCCYYFIVAASVVLSCNTCN